MSLRTDFPELQVGRLCELFGMTKQAYYQSISRKCDAESNDELILQLVMDIWLQMPRLGTRKILHVLRERYAVDVGVTICLTSCVTMDCCTGQGNGTTTPHSPDTI